MALIQSLTAEAGFVFEGQVVEPGASSSTFFPASKETVIVQVTKILKGPNSLAGYGGQKVTVVLQSPTGLQPGQSLVFFTHSLHFGDGLVVREVGNMPPEVNMESKVSSAAQANEDNQLQERLSNAEAVISGTASAPRPLESLASRFGHISEHDPDWQVVTVKVDGTHKGNVGGTQDVLFANSHDIAWHGSPKFKGGERGVWILHSQDHRGKTIPGLAVVHPLDFRPPEELAKVTTLLSSKE